MVWPKIPWKEIEDYLDKSVGKTLDTLFSTMEQQENEVKAKMDADMAKSRDLLADEIIHESSKKTAMIGGGAALPDLLPLGGWPVMIASIGGDFTLTLREELAMLSKLAYLYGEDSTREIRQREAIGLLAAVKASEANGRGSSTAEVSKLMAMMGAKHISRKIIANILKEIGKRFYKRKLIALIPGVGILLSGGVNYYSTRALGEYAKTYYVKRKVGNPEVDAIVDEIQHFQRCYLQVLVNMAKVDKKVPREEEDLLKDSLLMFGCTPEQQKHYVKDLYDLDAMNPVTPEQISKLSDDDRRYIVKQAVAMMLVDHKSSMAERNYLEMLRRLFGQSADTMAQLRKEIEEELGASEETA